MSKSFGIFFCMCYHLFVIKKRILFLLLKTIILNCRRKNKMNILNSLLNATASWQDVLNKLNENGNNSWGWVGTLMTTLSTVLWVLLALVGAAGGIYALYVGIKMARADSAEQREENKKRLINIVISIVVVIVLILFFNTFLPMILDAFHVFDQVVETPKSEALALLLR